MQSEARSVPIHMKIVGYPATTNEAAPFQLTQKQLLENQKGYRDKGGNFFGVDASDVAFSTF